MYIYRETKRSVGGLKPPTSLACPNSDPQPPIFELRPLTVDKVLKPSAHLICEQSRGSGAPRSFRIPTPDLRSSVKALRSWNLLTILRIWSSEKLSNFDI